MTEAPILPNPSDFSINEKDGEYTATFRVTGTITFAIKAASMEDAKAQAEAKADKISEDGYVEVEQLDDINVDYVQKDPPMYRVLREGKEMQVSRLRPGDLPRNPNKHGF